MDERTRSVTAIGSLKVALRQSKHVGLGLGVLVALGYILFGAFNVHAHGVAIDSPSLFRMGDRTLYWIEHGFNSDDMNLQRAEPSDLDSQFEYCPDGADRFHYPIFPAFVGAVTSRIVHDKLGWMDRVDAHHFGLVLLNAVALLLFAVYTTRLFGKAAGVASTLTLTLFPLALGHSLNNAKDWPCAQFYGLCLLAFGTGVLTRKPKHVLAGGVFAGIALASKLNGAFAIATAGAFACIAYVLLFHRKRRFSWPLFISVAAVPLVAFFVFFFTWPWLYYGQPHEWFEHIQEYVRFMANYAVGSRDTWTAYPINVVMWMTPPAVLVAAAFATLLTLRTHNRSELAKNILVLSWFLVPILRITLPHSNFYDMNRHFLEYVPALSVLAGRGVAALLEFVTVSLRGSNAAFKNTAIAGFSVAYGVGILAPAVQSQPFQSMYFNSFAGGLGGAQFAGLSSPEGMNDWRVGGCEGDYWFSTTRLAYEDALRHGARADTPIAICGPEDGLLRAWGRGLIPPFVYANTAAAYEASHMIIIPREASCCWTAIRQFERERRIVSRVELDGGLVYEVLGAYEGEVFEPTSSPNHYTATGRGCRAIDGRPLPPPMRRP